MTCGECKHYKKCFGHEKVFDYGCGYFELPVTNFDKVTESPEVLAKIISKALWHIPIYQSEEKCPFYKSCHELCDKDAMCDECITQWLKQEAKEVEE